MCSEDIYAAAYILSKASERDTQLALLALRCETVGVFQRFTAVYWVLNPSRRSHFWDPHSSESTPRFINYLDSAPRLTPYLYNQQSLVEFKIYPIARGRLDH